MASDYHPKGMIVIGWILQIFGVFSVLVGILILSRSMLLISTNNGITIFYGLFSLVLAALHLWYLILALRTRDQRQSAPARKAFHLALGVILVNIFLSILSFVNLFMILAWCVGAYYARRASTAFKVAEQDELDD